MPSLDAAGISLAAESRRRHSLPGDITIASLHWGGNWGYEIPEERIQFAHMLIDEAGFDLVHGHSSHHALAIEVHNGRLILYGCGDLLNDYEGIGGHEEYCPDIGLMYFADLARDGRLIGLHMSAFRSRRLRLERADSEQTYRIAAALKRAGACFGTSVEVDSDSTMRLAWRRTAG